MLRANIAMGRIDEETVRYFSVIMELAGAMIAFGASGSKNPSIASGEGGGKPGGFRARWRYLFGGGEEEPAPRGTAPRSGSTSSGPAPFSKSELETYKYLRQGGVSKEEAVAMVLEERAAQAKSTPTGRPIYRDPLGIKKPKK